MIVDRKKFQKFWKLPWNLPEIVFCNEKYYIPSLEEIEINIIPLYNDFIKRYNIGRNNSWNCSKFSQTFKLVCDIYYKEKNCDAHFAISIAHIELKKSQYDHALNLIFYKKDDNIDYIFFEPESNQLYKDNTKFKNIKFLYF